MWTENIRYVFRVKTPFSDFFGVVCETQFMFAVTENEVKNSLSVQDTLFHFSLFFKVPVRSNFPKFMFVDFSKVYVAVTYQAKPFFNPSTRSPFFFHGISRILRPPLINHVPTAQ